MFQKIRIILLLLIIFTSCSQTKKVDYHAVNQPKYSTDNFLQKFPESNFIYDIVKFQNGKRQLYTEINIYEKLIRSLKGNIKTLSIRHIDTEGLLGFTYQIEFDKNGLITKSLTAYQEEKLKDITKKDTLFSNLDPKADDSIFIKGNLTKYVIYKGKLYAENSDLYDNFPLVKYAYHKNGNKALEKSLNSWKTTYYSTLGVMDSIVNQNQKVNPTEDTVDRYFYKNGVVTKYSQEQNKIINQKRFTTYARIVNAAYLKGTDLPTTVQETTYNDNYKKIGSKESFTYSYNDKNELISTLHTFDGENPTHMEIETNYKYEYDEKGNWTKITETTFHRDDPKRKYVEQYLIEYNYY